MFKKYKDVIIQLAVSGTLSVVLIALGLYKTPLNIVLTIFGALLGTFVLDLDYLFYAYYIEREKDFSKTLRGFLSHKDLGGAWQHIQHNKDAVDEKTLNSAFFQVLMAGITILAVSSTTSIFVKSLIVSTFANSLYRMAEYCLEGNAQGWFWAMKKIPNKQGILTYSLIMLTVLVYSLSIF